MIRLILLSLILMISQLKAEKPFEGSITYSIHSDKAHSDQAHKIPQTITSSFKDGKMRLDVLSPEFDFNIITNHDKQDATFIISIKEGILMKLALKTTKDNLKSEFDIEDTPELKYTKEKKKIEGYICQKVILNTDDGNAYVYVTEDLNARGANWLFDNKIKGTILEAHISDDDGHTIIRATQIKAHKVSDTAFQMPTDCIFISSDDAKNMIGGSIRF